MPVIVIAPWDIRCSLYFSFLPVLSPFLLLLCPFLPPERLEVSFAACPASEEQVLPREDTKV